MSETTAGTGADLVSMVAELRPGGSRERPFRHQAIVLLWALGRTRHRRQRLVRWSEARGVLRDGDAPGRRGASGGRAVR